MDDSLGQQERERDADAVPRPVRERHERQGMSLGGRLSAEPLRVELIRVREDALVRVEAVDGDVDFGAGGNGQPSA